MKTWILFFSLASLCSCATDEEQKTDLLGLKLTQSYPEAKTQKSKPRLPVYLFPHVNALGDYVGGSWLEIADSRL